MKITLTAKEFTELNKTMIAYGYDKQFEEQLIEMQEMNLYEVETMTFEVPEEMITSIINLSRQVAPEVMSTIAALKSSYILFKGIFDSIFAKFSKFENEAKRFAVGYTTKHFNDEGFTWEVTCSGRFIVADDYMLTSLDRWFLRKAIAETNVPFYLKGSIAANRLTALREENERVIKERCITFDEREDGSVAVSENGLVTRTLSAVKTVRGGRK